MPRPDPIRASRATIHAAIVAAALIAVFANALPNDFHLDDEFRIVRNPEIRRIGNPWRHFSDPATSSTNPQIVEFRPLLPLSLSLSHAVSGDSAAGYRVGNLLIHFGACLALYALVIELGRRSKTLPPEAALATALLFAVHPVSGTVVNYLCARDLGLMWAFSLAGLLVYARMRRTGESVGGWAATIALVALSMLSKGNPVVFPIAVLAFDAIVEGDSLRSAGPWRRAALAAAPIAAYFAWVSWVLGFSLGGNAVPDDASFELGYPLTQLRLHLFWYARNLVWPFLMRMAPRVDVAESLFEPGVLAGLAFVIASLALAWRVRRVLPVAAFAIVAYWIWMVPESSIFPLHHPAVDYRGYPSSAFAWLLLSAASFRLLPGRRLAATVATLLAVGAGASSIALNTAWRTPRSLWERSVTLGGDQLAHLSYANSLDDPRDPRVRRHHEEALRLAPDYALAHLSFAAVLLETNETAEAIPHLRRAEELALTWPAIQLDVARGYADSRLYPDAHRAASRAAKLAPNDPAARREAALAAARVGAVAESRAELDAWLALDPGNEEALKIRGQLP